jgi:hypothetical protein
MVVDITQGDGRNQIRETVQSILAKCLAKKEDVSSYDTFTFFELDTEKLKISQDTWTKSDPKAKVAVLESKLDRNLSTEKSVILRFNPEFKYKGKVIGNDTYAQDDLRTDVFSNSACFLVSTKGENEVLKKWNDYLLRIRIDIPNTFIFVVENGGKNLKKEDYILNAKVTVFSLGENEVKMYENITFGNVCALASTEFTDLSVLGNKESGTPQNIAKALGYEIPDNYTPKQGGIKKEDKAS